MFDSGGAVFIDARTSEEFEAGQIEGAISVPFEDWRELLPDVQPWIEGQETVIYAGERTIDSADDLAAVILSRGQPRPSVFLFIGGFEEWSASGLPVRRGPAPPLAWPEPSGADEEPDLDDGSGPAAEQGR